MKLLFFGAKRMFANFRLGTWAWRVRPMACCWRAAPPSSILNPQEAGGASIKEDGDIGARQASGTPITATAGFVGWSRLWLVVCLA